MKQQLFESRYGKDWQQLETLLAADEPKTKGSSREAMDPAILVELPQLYRRVCHQLALAKHRGYSQPLIDSLNTLALRCHHQLYRNNTRFRHQWLRFVVVDFPQTLRANVHYVWLATALFTLPLLLVGILCFANEEMIYSVAAPEDVRNYESMYDKNAKNVGRDRNSGDDVVMFGFYIKHNISISFQMFAGGILFGVGSIFFLIFNGVHIGAVAGYLAQAGLGETFFPFVIGHGAFELTALVFSGAAGLKLGFALVDPGPYSRATALRIAGRQAVRIIYGSTLMLIIAAFLEAFWSSSSSIPAGVRYTVGGTFWVLVMAYCAVSGKGSHPGEESDDLTSSVGGNARGPQPH